MRHRDNAAALLFALALAASVIAGIAAPAAAGHGEGKGNYTVDLPFDSDHYPRSENGHNASINHFAAGTKKAYREAGAPKGVKALDWVVIRNQDIDFSECSSENTAAYGIDRGNNNSGTETDVSLLRYMEESNFNKHSITVDHYDGDELAAPPDSPVSVYPEDEIVAHQGYKSQGGPCYGMPKEPGWYQINGKLNGTNHDGEPVTIHSISHYFYICVCDSEQEARNKLGPPPSEQGSGSGGGNSSAPGNASSDNAGQSDNSTDSPTPTPTSTATPTPQATPTPTSADGGGGGGDDTQQSGGGNNAGGGQSTTTPTATPDGNGDGDGGQQRAQRRTATTEPIPTTPTIADGPGFGVGLALVALLGAALFALRRSD